jgi:CheY-like chemotaxis protein
MTLPRVLVVEDDGDLRELVVAVLTDLGYGVLEAANADEALQRLVAGDDVDLLFTDIVMPGAKDGFELAREALHRRPGLKLLYTTGFAREAGPEDVKAPVLKKPYRLSKMAAYVASALGNRA